MESMSTVPSGGSIWISGYSEKVGPVGVSWAQETEKVMHRAREDVDPQLLSLSRSNPGLT
jgi:hypothetical protein